jgi:hypothetical protein
MKVCSRGAFAAPAINSERALLTAELLSLMAVMGRSSWKPKTMAKQLKTRKELATLVFEEATKGGQCPDVASIFIEGPLDVPYASWRAGTMSKISPHLISAQSRLRMDHVIEMLQQKYDLSGE